EEPGRLRRSAQGHRTPDIERDRHPAALLAGEHSDGKTDVQPRVQAASGTPGAVWRGTHGATLPGARPLPDAGPQVARAIPAPGRARLARVPRVGGRRAEGAGRASAHRGVGSGPGPGPPGD